MVAFCTSTVALTSFFLFLLHIRGGKCKSNGGNSIKFVDGDYVGLALNLEYLETEFFLHGALGYGLDTVAPDLAKGGPPPIGAQIVPFWDPRVKDIITEFGYQEVGHLRAIQAKIGPRTFSRPLLNLSAATFAGIMNAAFGEVLSPPFNPYADDIHFLIASYVIPFVGLTGYVGAAPYLQLPDYKKLVAGLLGVESGQDAVIRALLYQYADWKVPPYNYTVAEFTIKISNLRNKLGNKEAVKDEGITVNKSQGAEGKVAGNVLAGDKYSLSYDRSPNEIICIVYGTGKSNKCGGFFPKCAKGNIAESYLSSKH